MEPWQEEHIRSNLSELLSKITCTRPLLDDLLSAKLIAQADVDIILSTTGGNMGQVSVLIKRVQQSSNGYVGLVKSLRRYNQTGAVDILMSHRKAEKLFNESQAAANQVDTAASRVIVGEGKCSINAVVTEVGKAAGVSKFLENWRSLARELQIPDNNKIKWQHEVNLGKKDLLDIFEDMVITWRNYNSSQATLQSLMNSITSCGSRDIADLLEGRFAE